MTAVREWLDSIGLDQYADAFEDNAVSWSLLPELDHEVLKEIGVSAAGHRLLILKAIRELDSGAEAASDEGSRAREVVPHDEAERRQLTVVFADLVGSTELARELDPEDLRDVTRAYQDAATAAIEKYDGYVARYMGDGVLAYFGYPRAHEEDAERAVRSGLDLVDRVSGLATRTRLSTRVGIATGSVVVGDLIGEGASQESAVVGEAPNLAARLQGAAPADGVVVAESTYELVKGVFIFTDLGALDLRGFPTGHRVRQVSGERTTATRFDAAHLGDLTPFVGRRSELGLLLDRWQASEEGEGQIVLLGGEPGMGKSRLLRALRDEIRTKPHTLLRFQCSPYQTISALYPVVQYLVRAADLALDDDDETKLRKLECLIENETPMEPEHVRLFAELLAIPHAPQYGELELSAEDRKERLLQALDDQLHSLSLKGPVLFLFEDAHWIDPTTLELLDRTARRSSQSKLFMVITHRPEWPQPAFSALSNVTSLSLNRLGQSHGAGIVLAISGASMSDEVIGRIVEHADGVPLFIEELTKTVLESDSGIDVSSIPTTLQASLLARLDRLGNEAKEIAQIGAAIGREFRHVLLAELAGKNESELLLAIERLKASELVFSVGTPPNAIYSFKHALVQDTAYDSLLLSRRRELHAQIVGALEQGSQGSKEDVIELLAYHARQADLPEKALTFCRIAGEKASERSTYAEAQQFLDTALEMADLIQAETPHPERIRALLAMRPSLGAVGDYPRLLSVLSEAEEIAHAIADFESAAVAGIHKAHVMYQCSQVEPAIEEGRRALKTAESLGEPRLTISASAILGMAYFFRGDLRMAVATAGPCANALCGEYRHARLETTATSSVNWLCNLSAMHALLGEFEPALEYSQIAMTIAEETHKPFDQAMSGHWRGTILVIAGREDEAIPPLERAMALVEEHRMPFLTPWAGKSLGVAYVRTGQQERGRSVLQIARNKAQELGLALAGDWSTVELAFADLQCGDFEAALDHADASRANATAAGCRWLEALAEQALARTHAERGALVVAEEHWRRAISLAEQCDAKPILAHVQKDLGDFYAQYERPDAAREVLGAALNAYRNMGEPSWISAAEASLRTVGAE